MQNESMEKILSIVLWASILGFSSLNVGANEATLSKATHVNNFLSTDRGLRTETIGWRYKVSNGILYRRQFNQTTGEWIGNWEVCP